MEAQRPGPGRGGEASLRVIVAEDRREPRQWLRRALADTYTLEEYPTIADTLRVALSQPPQAILVGGSLRDGTRANLLSELAALAENGAGAEIPIIVLDDGDGVATEEVASSDEGSAVFYVLRRPLPLSEVRALVESAVRSAAARAQAAGGIRSPHDAARLRRIVELSRRLALERELAGAATIAIAAVRELADAHRAQCLFYDGESGLLWTEGEAEAGIAGDSGPREHSANEGLAGFAARTGRQARAPVAAHDPRYAPAVDDPNGGGGEHILAQPIAAEGGEVHAVLVVVRDGDAPDFEPEARKAMREVAGHFSPILGQLALELDAESVLEQAKAREGASSVFRGEALEASAARRTRGDVVRVSPNWVTYSYWLILGSVSAALLYLSLGTVRDYSTGPALVRAEGRTDVTAPIGGTIAEIAASPGERVEAGDALARFYDADEAADYRRAREQWETQLKSYLFDPGDEAARRGLTDLRADVERARERLEERTVRAPHTGTVSDVRARGGRHVGAGDVLMTVAADEGDVSLIALLPGADRPQLAPGMTLRLELDGYRYAYQEIEVAALADEVIGPAEARRFLGEDVADLPMPPSVVIASADLPEETFEAMGETYHYHDGMTGIAEIETRSERIITALIPGLRAL